MFVMLRVLALGAVLAVVALSASPEVESAHDEFLKGRELTWPPFSVKLHQQALDAAGIAIKSPPDLMADTELKSGPVVQTTLGPVQGGVDSSTGVAEFLGIPFAEPPIGHLRFREPQPKQPWTETFSATKLGEICPQVKITDLLVIGDEDCLSLNVFVPPNTNSTAKKPVMVWIFGGGWVIGDGYEFGWYDGRNRAVRDDVIIVSMNYRVNTFGFLAHPALAEEAKNKTGQPTTGNMGVQDQRLAMQWIKDNIAKFGGDPDKTLLFGESAGGFSVCYHLGSPASAGLFSAAVVESGNCDVPWFFQPLPKALSYGESYGAKAGCANTLNHVAWLQCMRGLGTAEVMKGLLDRWTDAPLAPIMPYGVAIDGTRNGSVATPLEMIRRGAYNNVPTVFGFNNKEGLLFAPAIAFVVPGTHLPVRKSDFPLIMEHFFSPEVSDEALKLYNVSASSDSQAEDLAAEILTDIIFACAMKRGARAVADQGGRAFVYHFNADLHNWLDVELLGGDYHTTELSLVWNNEWPPLLHDFSDTERSLSDTMGKYWSNMARCGSPNCASSGSNQLFAWPEVQKSSQSPKLANIVLKLQPAVQTGYRDEVCAFWDKVADSTEAWVL